MDTARYKTRMVAVAWRSFWAVLVERVRVEEYVVIVAIAIATKPTSNKNKNASSLDAALRNERPMASFIERHVRRAKFDQALIDDEHPTPGAHRTRRDATIRSFVRMNQFHFWF